MVEPFLIFIAAAFLLAGLSRAARAWPADGGDELLAVTMPPAQALAIVIVPPIVTNIWQTFVGPYLRDILRRLGR